MSESYLALIVFLGIVFPAVSIWQGGSTKRFLIDHPEKLTSIFIQTIIIQIILTALVLFSLYQNDNTIDDIGLSFIRNIPISLLFFPIGLGFLWLLYTRKISPEKANEIRASHSEIKYLLPKNKKEFQWSIILSFGVGIMEEILYRGFLFWQLNQYLPLTAALIITNVIFGLLHYGTGFKNAFSTFVLGMVFSALSIPFDTLWFAILAHIMTDIYAMVMGFKTKEAFTPITQSK